MTASTKPRYLWLTIGFIVLGLMLIYGYDQFKIKPVTSASNLIDHTPLSVSTSEPYKEPILIPEKPEVEVVSDKPEIKSVDYSRSEALTTGSWMQRTGQLTHQERADYEDYDNETLTRLTETGDIKAMDILSGRYIAAGENAKALFYAKKATVYGSIGAITKLSILASPNILTPENERQRKYIEALALTNIIAMRGNPFLADLTKNQTMMSYNSDFKNSTALTAEDEENIKSVAVAIFNNIKQERLKLGLGEFEETPASAKKYMDVITQK